MTQGPPDRYRGPASIGEVAGKIVRPLVNFLNGSSKDIPKDIYVAFFDIDGTLHDNNHEIPDATLGRLEKARQERIIEILISGRAPASIYPVVELIGIPDPIIVAHHGARIEYKGSLIPNGSKPIPYESAKNAIEALDGRHDLWNKVDLLYFNNNVVPHREDDSPRMEEYRRRNPNLDYFKLGDDATPDKFFGPGEPDKLVVLTNGPEEAQDVKSYLEAMLDKEPLAINLTNGRYVELTHEDATKGNSVKIVLDYLRGMDPKHAIAFGDGMDDLEMADAGVWTFLMGNASEATKAKARGMKRVTLLDITNEDGAVGEVLAELMGRE